MNYKYLINFFKIDKPAAFQNELFISSITDFRERDDNQNEVILVINDFTRLAF